MLKVQIITQITCLIFIANYSECINEHNSFFGEKSLTWTNKVDQYASVE